MHDSCFIPLRCSLDLPLRALRAEHFDDSQHVLEAIRDVSNFNYEFVATKGVLRSLVHA